MAGRRHNLANLNLAFRLGSPLTTDWYSKEFKALGAIAHFDPGLGATDDGTTSTWTDQIGGYSVASTSQATRLTWSSSVAGLNNRPGWTGVAASLTRLVSADGTLSDRLDAGAAFSVYSVRKWASGVGCVWALGSTANGHGMAHGAQTAGQNWTSWYDGAGATGHTGVIQGTDARVDSVIFDSANLAQTSNGGVSTAAAANARLPVCNRFSIGGRILAGSWEASHWNGVIGDIVIFLGAHTDAQRRVVERLLAEKYGWPVLRGVTGFSTSNYLANAALTSGVRGSNTLGVWAEALIRPDAVPGVGAQYLETAWATTSGQSIVSNTAALGFTAGNATANATSPTRTIAAADVGNLMLFGGSAGPANLVRGFVNGAEIGAGTALTGYAKDTATAFSVGARAALSPATSYSLFGVLGGDVEQVVANHAARAAAIKAAGRYVFTGGATATHGWRFETPAAYHADRVDSDMLTRTGTLTETQCIVPSWRW